MKVKVIIITVFLVGLINICYGSNNTGKVLREVKKVESVNKNQFDRRSPRNDKFLELVFSPGLMTTVGIGSGFVSENNKNENSFMLHLAGLPSFKENVFSVGQAGVNYQRRMFKNPERTGVYGVVNAGIDGNLFFGGIVPTPNLSGGIGFSKKTGKNRYFRTSVDVGVKVFLINLNFSICQ